MLTTATGSVITTMANTPMLGVSRVITTVIRTLATMAITRSGINAAIPIIIAAMDDGILAGEWHSTRSRTCCEVFVPATPSLGVGFEDYFQASGAPGSD